MHPNIKFLLFLVFVVLLLGTAWLIFSGREGEVGPLSKDELVIDDENTVDLDGVLVTEASPATTGSRLPAGFPRDIPVEEVNVTESYRAVYTENRAAQYTVSYTSNKSRDSLWDTYNSFMKGAGYAIETTGTSKSQGQLMGNKDNDTLSVIISARTGMTLVQINLLDRDL